MSVRELDKTTEIGKEERVTEKVTSGRRAKEQGLNRINEIEGLSVFFFSSFPLLCSPSLCSLVLFGLLSLFSFSPFFSSDATSF